MAQNLLGYDGGSGCETRAAYYANGMKVQMDLWGSIVSVTPEAAIENLREMLSLSESRDFRAISDLISAIQKAYPEAQS
jgi:hypothetical protein